MALITSQGQLVSADLYSNTATPGDNMSIGQIAWDGNTGKAFRYALAGASSLVMGNLLQESVRDTTYENMAVLATAAGSEFLNVTNGTATITSAQFVGGSLSVYTAGTVAIGDEYTITGITGTLTTGGALKVYTDRPLRAAFTTSAKVVMKRSPWSGVIQFPASTQTGIPVGVAINVITNAQYGWVQTHGVASVLSDGSTFAVGSNVGSVSGTAGAVTVYDAATTLAAVGIAREAAASASAINVFLQID